MTAPVVVAGAQLVCSMGAAPSALVLPPSPVAGGGRPVATATDAVPNTNILPFGLCRSLANPTVASATAAALGALTPMPCVPVIVGGWTQTSTKVTAGGRPVVVASSRCACAWGGQVSVVSPGQTSVLA